MRRQVFCHRAGGIRRCCSRRARGCAASALPVLMAALYLTPAILLVVQRRRELQPRHGLAAAAAGTRRCRDPARCEWSLPRRWQWPLVTWATIVSIAWPIVFLREADFALWILPLARVSNTSIGIGPWEVGLNVTYFALAHNAGILFDRCAVSLVSAAIASGSGERCWRRSRSRRQRRARSRSTRASSISRFLNRPFWTYMIRASGTLADPNKLGAVDRLLDDRRRGAGAPNGAALAGGGDDCGAGARHRRGLAVADRAPVSPPSIVSVAIAAWEGVAHWRSTRSSARVDVKRVAGDGRGRRRAGRRDDRRCCRSASTHTVVARGTLGYIPFFGDRGSADSVNELLWERFGYGPAAIADDQGASDRRRRRRRVPRARPRLRQGRRLHHSATRQRAELVASSTSPSLASLGSIPLLWWCVVFADALMFSRRRGGDRLSIGIAARRADRVRASRRCSACRRSRSRS